MDPRTAARVATTDTETDRLYAILSQTHVTIDLDGMSVLLLVGQLRLAMAHRRNAHRPAVARIIDKIIEKCPQAAQELMHNVCGK